MSPDALDIERPAALEAYLRQTRRLGPGERVEIDTLAGGVSNRTVRVRFPDRDPPTAWVLKQALAKLRVSVDWFSDPARIRREAEGLRWLIELAPPGCITPLVFEDPENHLLAMEAVPEPHENFKAMLMAGRIDVARVRDFGRLLGTIHRHGWERREELAAVFDDRQYFQTLRLEPYYEYTARQVPEASGFLRELIASTLARRLTVVHGDYSPKNVLIHDGRVVLLDHEVIHFGDPAFDVGFALAHFLSKARHFWARRERFLKAAVLFYAAYRSEVKGAPWAAEQEAHVIRQTLGCLLARVAGRSPLEYLNAHERRWQREALVPLMRDPPGGVGSLFVQLLTRAVPMPVVGKFSAMEILDSRGRPTVKATCELAGAAGASASVPSGASTGAAEALELRDGDPTRYRGLGCRKAVANVNGPIADCFRGHDVADQADFDRRLIELDGTPNKGRLGANAILAASIAFARAEAARRGEQLYVYFARLFSADAAWGAVKLPRLTVNLFSGGKHAGGQVAIQDVLLVPASAKTIDEGLATVFAVYQAAADLVLRKYAMRGLRADEGGLAPAFPSTDAMLQDAVAAIEAAGYVPGRDVALAVDVASSHFFRDGRYYLDGQALDSQQMIGRLSHWVERYPIVSVEDGLHEEDWPNWPLLRQALAGRALVLGDDFLCTQPARICRAVEAKTADALLLKVNQIGTLSEAAEACRLARAAGWAVTVSARSGETEDDWLADLAVAWGDQIKVGSITQSERLAKYNRLLAIEAERGFPVVSWPA